MKNMSQQDIEKQLIALTQQLLIESGETHKREIRLDSSLHRHLGVDSLGRAELFRRIEKTFDVNIPDSMLAEADTLADISAFVQTAGPRIKLSERHQIITSHGEHSRVDPMRASTLIDLVLMYGEKSPEKPHIYFQHEDGSEEIITYGALLKSSLRVASGLRERGLQEGDTVAIMLPTHPGFFYTFFGVLLAGGVPVPIYPPFRAHMLEAYAKMEARILSNAEVRVLVTFNQAEKLSQLLKAFVPSLKHVTTVDELMQPTMLNKIFHAKADNHAFIQYTSGSTADPKGVLLSHHNLISNIRAYGKAVKVTPDDIAVSWLPLYHDMGLIGMWLGSLFYGLPLILMTPFTFLNRPERWLWAIHYHRGTLTGAPNFAYELCVRKIEPEMIEGLDLSSWRMAANGAEKVYPRTLDMFAKKFAPYGFKKSALLPVYGLAESTVGLAIPPIGREFWVDHVDREQFEMARKAEPAKSENELAFVSCGLPIDGHEIRIVDDKGQVLPERHVGNLQFRGPSSMQGYYNNPRATKAVFHHGGWIDSGDLAYLADGEVFITGRRKDLIVKAGRNLYPVEIEELVGNVEGIRQGCVAAFSVNDTARGTEELIVVAETRENNKDKRRKIVEGINDVMSTSLDVVPDHVVLVAPRIVPKTSSGKLQRSACKKMYMENKLGRKQLPAWMQMIKLGAEWLMRQCAAGVRFVAEVIYTAYVALVTALTLLPVWLVLMFATRHAAAKVCRFWARWLLRFALCPLRIKGEENLAKMSPVIFASNHASYIDSIVMMAIVPPNTLFVGKKELLTTPVLSTFMRKLGYLAVDRTDLPKGLEDTRYMEQALREGHSIVIFPEGTFGYASGLRPFRLGAFKIAAETATPVCPVGLKGTRGILRDVEKLMRPGKITVTICEPIKPSGSEWQDVTQLRTLVRAEVAKYCGEPTLDLIAAQAVAPKPPVFKEN